MQLQSVDAPAQVISAYRDVTAAQQDQQRAVNEAETYANRVVPEAEGERRAHHRRGRGVQAADRARGQGPDRALRSRSTRNTRRRRGVTRERMYLETMESVLGGMNKTILDAKAARAPVPYIAVEPRGKPAGAAK